MLFNYYKLSYREKQFMNETNKELEKYYEQMLELFRTDGWKTLIEDLKTNGEGINNVEGTHNLEDLYYRKGQLYVIATLLNLEEQIRIAYDELGDEDVTSI